jgi:hypothetical protein
VDRGVGESGGLVPGVDDGSDHGDDSGEQVLELALVAGEI